MTDNNDDDTVDLEELVGNVLDSRGLTKERIESLDGLASIKDDILSAFKSAGGGSKGGNSTAPKFDEEGFLAKVTELIDSKVAGATAPSTPPLKRWLGLA